MAAYEPIARNYSIFPTKPKVGSGKVLAANTNVDGTGTLVPVFPAGADGAIVDSISIVHLGANTAATVLRLFVKDGSNYSLFFEKTIPTNAGSQVAESVFYDILFNGTDRKRLILPPNSQIVACVGTALTAGLLVTCFGGDY
ncbi:hypothetical protein [Cohnella sp. AR92]|uniref:hypothetical protein n=1 Tax=Cohnella sp. AR92 TaxID=648716 RepID=UPI000F8EB3EF|nr:hypothetical protein [Cohnella sp. AR92]RUS42269.1 hypothetical protein ELR57_27030 [Cohnella sp. AR92]